MSKQLVQTVYVPTKVEEKLPEREVIAKNISNDFLVGYVYKISDDDYWCEDDHQRLAQTTHWLKPQEGIFFTVEEYNKHIKKVIEETLKNGAEEASVKDFKVNYTGVRAGGFYIEKVIDKDSILNTFEQSYKKFSI